MRNSITRKLKTTLLITSLAAVAMGLTACGGGDTTATSSEPTLEVKLTATSFEFDQKEIRVKKGQKVKLSYVNNKGTHSVDIPEFKVSVDKQNTPVEFVASKAGTFEYKCGIMCGADHGKMIGKLIVE